MSVEHKYKPKQPIKAFKRLHKNNESINNTNVHRLNAFFKASISCLVGDLGFLFK